MHPHVVRHFDFRCLRENRRVVQDESRRAELDCFHKVLTDISHGVASIDVRNFMIDAYVRGFQIGTAEHVPFEGRTLFFLLNYDLFHSSASHRSGEMKFKIL